eukprot:SAG31_NODE_3333_length_4395_cov_2.924814_5_plen_41_part_00
MVAYRGSLRHVCSASDGVHGEKAALEFGLSLRLVSVVHNT